MDGNSRTITGKLKFEHSYYAAHLCKSLLWYLSAILFAYFLTEACGFSPATMGAILAASLICNAIMDALLGCVLGKFARTVQAASRLQLFGAAAAAIAVIGFAFSPQIPEQWRTAYVLVSLFVFRCTYSLFDVPQNAILGLLAHDDNARARIAGGRLVLSAAAQLLIASSFIALLRGFDGEVLGDRFMIIAAGCGAVALTSSAALVFAARRQPEVAQTSPTGAFPSIARKEPFKGKRLLFASAVLSFTIAGGRIIEPYVADFSISRDEATAFLMSIAIGQMIGPLLWWRLARKQTLIDVFRWSVILLILSNLGFLMLGRGALIAMVPSLLYGVAISGAGQMIWSMTAAWSAVKGNLPVQLVGMFDLDGGMADLRNSLAI